MINKFFKILLLILLISLTISAVYSYDGNETNIEIQDTDSNLIVGDVNFNEGNFTELQKEVGNIEDNGILVLDKNYTMDDNEDTISLNHNIIIDGQGIFLKRNSSGYIFSTTKTVTLTNINFINGGVSGIVGSLTLINCTFINNLDESNYLGLYLFSSSADIMNCNFHNISGGAIRGDSKTLRIANTNFTCCKSNKGGGTIDWSGGEVVIDRCNFTDNVEAIYLYNVKLDLKNSAFARNNQTALWLNGNEAQISYCLFAENFHDGDGGALYLTGDEVKINDCTFESNSVTGEKSGGAIYSEVKSLFIKSSNFIDNKAIFAAAIESYSQNTTVVNSTFKSNCITNSNINSLNKAIIVISGNEAIIDNSTFLNNNACTIYWQDGIGSVKNSNFTKNNGCIEWESDNGIVDNCIFENSSASAVVWFGERGTLKNSIFHNNVADRGSAIDWMGSNGKITDSQFTYNEAKTGGAIYNYAVALSIDRCAFLYNKANTGGAIYWENSNGAVKNSVFKHNSAKKFDGAIYYDSIDFNKRSSNNTFYNNTPVEIEIAFKSTVKMLYKSGQAFTVKVTEKLSSTPVKNVKTTLLYFDKTFSFSTNDKGIALCSKLSSLRFDGFADLEISFNAANKYIINEIKLPSGIRLYVLKASTIIKAPSVTNKYHKNSYFKVLVKHKTTKKTVSGLKVKLKVYTGKKYKVYTVKTNSKGYASLNTRLLNKGSHKVIIYSGDSSYKISAKSTIKIR